MSIRWRAPGAAAVALFMLAGCGDVPEDGGSGAGSPDAGATGGPDGGPDAAVDLGAFDMGSGSTDAGPSDMGGGEMDAGVDPECEVNSDCSGDTPYCDPIAAVCAPPPRGGLIGWGNGTTDSVVLESIHAASEAAQATDLAFNPSEPEQLWMVHRFVPRDAPCDQPPGDTSGCFELQGSTTTIFDYGTPQQSTQWIMDFNAWHFMRRPPAIAFGDNGFFATCGEARTGNYLDDQRADFIGPSLWTSDPEIYRNWEPNEAPRGWNGTHMDMLHATPFCMGIAHERDNVYWVANGQIGSFDRYNFNEDHGPGQADHSDGVIFRYAIGTVTRVPFVPGHLEFHDGKVYAADTGGGRIVSFDPEGAVRVGSIEPQYEPLADSATFEGGTLSEVVAPGGLLVRPSGLAIHDGVLYVSDNATSQIHAFELDGTHLRLLQTGLPPGSLAGIEAGPDGLLYFVNLPESEVLRIVPQ